MGTPRVQTSASRASRVVRGLDHVLVSSLAHSRLFQVFQEVVMYVACGVCSIFRLKDPHYTGKLCGQGCAKSSPRLVDSRVIIVRIDAPTERCFFVILFYLCFECLSSSFWE